MGLDQDNRQDTHNDIGQKNLFGSKQIRYNKVLLYKFYPFGVRDFANRLSHNPR